MNVKKALERLKEETQPNAYTLNHNDKDFTTIEKALERLEKLEKAIEILKNRIEFEDLGEMQSGNVYRPYFNDCLDQQEYELLNEVLAE